MAEYVDSFPIIIITLILFVVFLIVKLILSSPFHYPYFTHKFDISHKRKVNIEDYIDRFLCDPQNWRSIQLHEENIQRWKIASEDYVKKCTLLELRNKQYYTAIDDAHAYQFYFVRMKTRYVQKNYIRTSYKVPVNDTQVEFSYEWLIDRYAQLEEIGFESTLKEYHSKNQRKLMTPLLKTQIKERDNYTCQECGKYMPDEVGLQIDHIVPVAKGGKSIPSNLQVLCSKCNGKKGAKL